MVIGSEDTLINQGETKMEITKLEIDVLTVFYDTSMDCCFECSIDENMSYNNVRDVAQALNSNCQEIMFMASLLPAMSQDMDADTREFFRENYGVAMYLSGLNPLKQGQYHKSGWWLLS